MGVAVTTIMIGVGVGGTAVGVTGTGVAVTTIMIGVGVSGSGVGLSGMGIGPRGVFSAASIVCSAAASAVLWAGGLTLVAGTQLIRPIPTITTLINKSSRVLRIMAFLPSCVLIVSPNCADAGFGRFSAAETAEYAEETKDLGVLRVLCGKRKAINTGEGDHLYSMARYSPSSVCVPLSTAHPRR